MQLESGGRRDPIGVNAPLDLSGTTPVGWAAVCSKCYLITIFFLFCYLISSYKCFLNFYILVLF